MTLSPIVDVPAAVSRVTAMHQPEGRAVAQASRSVRDTAIEASAVCRGFGDRQVLLDLSFAVSKGSVTALLGSNGAGKSTLISLLLGLRAPSSGHVNVLGSDPRRREQLHRIGATLQESAFSTTAHRLLVREVLSLVASHYQNPVPVDELVETYGLTSIWHRELGGLSGGERRRVSISLAFIGRPDLVVLDEPTTGLDIAAREAVWRALTRFTAGGGTALVATHHLEEAEAVADRVLLIESGRLMVDDTLDGLRERVGRTELRFRSDRDPPTPQVGTLARADGAYVVQTTEPELYVTQLVRSEVAFRDLSVTRAGLSEMLKSLKQ